MSPHRAAIGAALIGATLSGLPVSGCEVVERSVEPREGGADASSTGPASGGAEGTGGKGTGGKGSGGSTGGRSSGDASPEDAAADAANDANAATGGVTGTGGGGVAGSGGTPVRRDAGTDSCRRLPGLGDVVLCDDFEEPVLSSQWRPFATDGPEGSTHLVPAPFPSRDQGALISTKKAAGPRNPLYADVLGGVTSGHLYLRAWMYFPANATITNDIKANATLFVLGESQGPSYRGCGVALWRDHLTTQCDGKEGGSYATPPTVLPPDQWVCIRYDFPIGEAIPPAGLRVRIGDATLANTVTTPTATALDTGYTRVWLGVNHISDEQETGVVVYYDDVVVDTKDIACD